MRSFISLIICFALCHVKARVFQARAVHLRQQNRCLHDDTQGYRGPYCDCCYLDQRAAHVTPGGGTTG
ncbi:hypothetical protein PF011_g7074 [Phytophthora fragariae]|uniref:RxLR effector protein n=1 Tax=Phytophthora fragariae TaxID=53985 RepID=A0A6A3LEV0_9STRA|nr:hypothetical protein PF011_g7074 [Phytophthora fragariae]KAE9354923.1 hypothetical protein PF008_g4302 [Phytophthora fragariae]